MQNVHIFIPSSLHIHWYHIRKFCTYWLNQPQNENTFKNSESFLDFLAVQEEVDLIHWGTKIPNMVWPKNKYKVPKSKCLNITKGNFLHSICIVFHIVSNLEIIWSTWRMYSLYANTTPLLYIGLDVALFLYHKGRGGPGTSPLGYWGVIVLVDSLYWVLSKSWIWLSKQRHLGFRLQWYK